MKQKYWYDPPRFVIISMSRAGHTRPSNWFMWMVSSDDFCVIYAELAVEDGAKEFDPGILGRLLTINNATRPLRWSTARVVRHNLDDDDCERWEVEMELGWTIPFSDIIE